MSWCMAASMKLGDIKELKEELEKIKSPADRAKKGETLCKEHIDDWCQLQYPSQKDMCTQAYHKLLPLGKEGQQDDAFDPVFFLDQLGGWHGAKEKFKKLESKEFLYKSLPAENAMVQRVNKFLESDEVSGLRDLAPSMKHSITNSIMMRIAGDVRKMFEDFSMLVGSRFVRNNLAPGKAHAAVLTGSENGVSWGAEGSVDVTSDMDVNAKFIGTSAAVQATLRLFRRLLYGAGLTRYVSPAMLFDLNTYCEDFIQLEFFKPDTRVKYALAVIGDTEGEESTFFQRQANNLMATVMMLVRNTKKFAAAMGWTRGQVLDRVLPGKGDVPVAIMKQALTKQYGTAVTDAVATTALESFHTHMDSVTALAHDCTLTQYKSAIKRFNVEFGKAETPKETFDEVEAQLDEVITAGLGTRFTSAPADTKKHMVEDVKTVIFQAMSREASKLSDRLGSMVAEQPDIGETKSVRKFPGGTSDAHKRSLDVLREFLRLVVAATAPEAYASGPATRWTVLLDQVFATGVTNGRKPDKPPNGPALPLHNLDVVLALLEQVAFTLEHWGDDLEVKNAEEAKNSEPWAPALAGSAKYFARAGTALLYLDHGDSATGRIRTTKQTVKEVEQDTYPFMTESTTARDPAKKPPLDDSGGFVLDVDGEDSRLMASLRTLVLDPLVRNSEFIVDVGKRKGFWSHVVENDKRPQNEAEQSAFEKVFFGLKAMDGKVGFGEAFLMGVRRVVGRAMVRSLAAGKCFKPDGTWNAARCSPTVKRGCEVTLQDGAEVGATQAKVPIGKELWEHLASNKELEAAVDSAVASDGAACKDSLRDDPTTLKPEERAKCLKPTPIVSGAMAELFETVKLTRNLIVGNKALRGEAEAGAGGGAPVEELSADTRDLHVEAEEVSAKEAKDERCTSSCYTPVNEAKPSPLKELVGEGEWDRVQGTLKKAGLKLRPEAKATDPEMASLVGFINTGLATDAGAAKFKFPPTPVPATPIPGPSGGTAPPTGGRKGAGAGGSTLKA